MKNKKLEPFLSRIIFKYRIPDAEGRTIAYLYNRESLNELINIKKHKEDNSQFITIGDIVILEGKKCKVVEINFKLDSETNDMTADYGINLLSPSEPTNYNCQIGIFVERID